MPRTVLIAILAVLLIAIAAIVVLLFVTRKKGPKAPKASKQPKSAKQAKKRLNKMKKGQMDIEPEDDEDDLYELADDIDNSEAISKLYDQHNQQPQAPIEQSNLQQQINDMQQQVQPQPVYNQTVTQPVQIVESSGMKFEPNTPLETVARELLKNVAYAISQNSITRLSAVVKDPLLKYLAGSVYTLTKEEYRRNFEIVSISNERIVNTKHTNTSEYNEAACTVEYKDYLIKDTIIGNKEQVFRKEVKLMFVRDIMSPDIFWLTNTNLS